MINLHLTENLSKSGFKYTKDAILYFSGVFNMVIILRSICFLVLTMFVSLSVCVCLLSLSVYFLVKARGWFQGPSPFLSTLFLWDGISHCTWSSTIVWSTSGTSQGSISFTSALWLQLLSFLHWFWEYKLRSSSLISYQFADWTIFPIPLLCVYVSGHLCILGSVCGGGMWYQM